MLKRFMTFVKGNKLTFIILLVGLIGLLCFNIRYNICGQRIFGWLRLWKYLALLVSLISLYILFIRAKRVILSNVLLLSILVLIVETTLFFMLGMPDAYKKDFTIPHAKMTPYATEVGNYNSEDAIISDIKLDGKDTVFAVNYTFDKYRRRVTPDFDSTRTKYSLFFGCSIGFGYGLEDNQTFAYQVQEKSKTANSYNYSMSGTGTNQMLAWLQYKDLSKQVKETDGCAYYVFFWDHIYRAVGTMNRYTEWLSLAPYYYMKDGKLVRKKLFKDGRPFVSSLYENVYQTSIVKYFKLDLPVRLNEYHFDLVTEMILESKREYKKQFGNDKFYVVIYPNYMFYTDEEMKSFKRHLKQKHIKFVDLNKKLVYGGEHTLGGDPHPNAETNRTLADYLLQELKKQQ